jgi:hypothetical protein
LNDAKVTSPAGKPYRYSAKERLEVVEVTNFVGKEEFDRRSAGRNMQLFSPSFS